MVPPDTPLHVGGSHDEAIADELVDQGEGFVVVVAAEAAGGSDGAVDVDAAADGGQQGAKRRGTPRQRGGALGPRDQDPGGRRGRPWRRRRRGPRSPGAGADGGGRGSGVDAEAGADGGVGVDDVVVVDGDHVDAGGQGQLMVAPATTPRGGHGALDAGDVAGDGLEVGGEDNGHGNVAADDGAEGVFAVEEGVDGVEAGDGDGHGQLVGDGDDGAVGPLGVGPKGPRVNTLKGRPLGVAQDPGPSDNVVDEGAPVVGADNDVAQAPGPKR